MNMGETNEVPAVDPSVEVPSPKGSSWPLQKRGSRGVRGCEGCRVSVLAVLNLAEFERSALGRTTITRRRPTMRWIRAFQLKERGRSTRWVSRLPRRLICVGKA